MVQGHGDLLIDRTIKNNRFCGLFSQLISIVVPLFLEKIPRKVYIDIPWFSVVLVIYVV